MNEEQKQRELAIIAENARIAERHGLEETAKMWRRLHDLVAGRRAEDMISAKSRADKPANPA
jgi:hypothetical protein